MSSVSDTHNQAMDKAFFADRERRRGNRERATELFEQALNLELAAIAGMDESDGMSWAVLHRSAGWLALGCNQPHVAEQLAVKALVSEPHPEIAEELRDLLEQANFHRHLEPKGIVLSEWEIQLSLVGRAVANGLALWADLMPRTNGFQALIYRIVQRKLNLPYTGGIPTDIRNSYHTFVSPPRTGSFAISLRLGQTLPNPSFPGFLGPADVINEFIDLMEFANGSLITEIQQRIPDMAYRQNFLGLARKLAPDGKEIRQVGFTAFGDGDTRTLSVTTPASRFPIPDIEVSHQSGDAIEVSGSLRYADASARRRNSNQIKIVNDNGPSYEIVVPEGLMDDIVRPLWNSYVTVRGSKRARGNIIRLHEIWESDPSSGQEIGQRISIAANSDIGMQQSLF